MARSEKTGLDYFSHDTDMFFDTKMKYVRAKYKLVGYAVYNRLLEIIYRDKGYFLDLSDEYILLLSDELRVDKDELETIINDFIDRELFNRVKYDNYRILTSKRIQKNYVRGCERRKSIHLCKEYLLVNPESIISEDSKGKPQIIISGINEDINKINEDINFNNEHINKQSKSKREKSETTVNVKNTSESTLDILTSDDDLPLPNLPDLNDYIPSNFDDDIILKEAIEKLLSELTIQPDKSTITSFFNIVSKKCDLTKQVKKESSFKMLYELCNNWKTFKPEQKNFSYLYKTFSGKISDRLIKARENNNKVNKRIEKVESENVNDPSTMEIIKDISDSVKVA